MRQRSLFFLDGYPQPMREDLALTQYGTGNLGLGRLLTLIVPIQLHGVQQPTVEQLPAEQAGNQ